MKVSDFLKRAGRIAQQVSRDRVGHFNRVTQFKIEVTRFILVTRQAE